MQPAYEGADHNKTETSNCNVILLIFAGFLEDDQSSFVLL